jgi:hypothetical protein
MMAEKKSKTKKATAAVPETTPVVTPPAVTPVVEAPKAVPPVVKKEEPKPVVVVAKKEEPKPVVVEKKEEPKPVAGEAKPVAAEAKPAEVIAKATILKSAAARMFTQSIATAKATTSKGKSHRVDDMGKPSQKPMGGGGGRAPRRGAAKGR